MENGKKVMKKAIVIFLLIIGACVAYAKTQQGYGCVFVDKIVRIYDGDTFYVNINQWPKILGKNIGIRVNGIDTPEMRGSSPEVKNLALQAKTLVYESLTTADVVVLKNIKRGKYFRVVADVEFDGRDLAQELINAGLAKRYDGGTKSEWTIEDINN